MYNIDFNSLIENNHEAIIPKELYYRMQKEKARRGAILATCFKEKGCTACQGKVQCQIHVIQHHGMRRMRLAQPQEGYG
ncbi:hypothetical protein LBYZC6_20280 [Lacrimispora brassicae]